MTEKISEYFGDYLIEHWPYRSGFASTDTHVHVVEFRVLRIESREADGTPSYNYSDGCPTSEPDKATAFLYGSIKWDGCSNWMFPECADNCMIHFCDRAGPVFVGALFERMFEIAKVALAATRDWE